MSGRMHQRLESVQFLHLSCYSRIMFQMSCIVVTAHAYIVVSLTQHAIAVQFQVACAAAPKHLLCLPVAIDYIWQCALMAECRRYAVSDRYIAAMLWMSVQIGSRAKAHSFRFIMWGAVTHSAPEVLGGGGTGCQYQMHGGFAACSL